MATIEDLVSQLPIDQIAQQFGVDRETAAAASREASEALVQGMQANAQDEAGASSLAAALGDHARQADAHPAGAIDLSRVDTRDGAAIVRNVFGDNEEQVVNQLGGLGGGDGSSLFKSLLPLLAPLVMGFIGKQAAGSGGGGQQGGGGGGLFGGGGLGDMLGGLLGGGGGGGLGDLLGGLLGGGKR